MAHGGHGPINDQQAILLMLLVNPQYNFLECVELPRIEECMESHALASSLDPAHT